jgi:hypothetical protein
MITKLRFWWQEMWSSYWFAPTLIVLSAVALAMLLVILEPLGDLHLVERWPLFFGASPSSASGLLTTVASSMITVAGVVFSITLVSLSLTASHLRVSKDRPRSFESLARRNAHGVVLECVVFMSESATRRPQNVQPDDHPFCTHSELSALLASIAPTRFRLMREDLFFVKAINVR